MGGRDWISDSCIVMATPLLQIRAPDSAETTVDQASPGMAVKRDENDGVIPRWFVGSFIVLVIAVLGQWGWLISSNARLDERLLNFNEAVKAQSMLLNNQIERERQDREREQKTTRDQLELLRLEQHQLTVKLAERGFRVR